VDVHNEVGECTIRICYHAKSLGRTTGNESFRRSIVVAGEEDHLGGSTSFSNWRKYKFRLKHCRDSRTN
jgi:hypothetical protein